VHEPAGRQVFQLFGRRLPAQGGVAMRLPSKARHLATAAGLRRGELIQRTLLEPAFRGSALRQRDAAIEIGQPLRGSQNASMSSSVVRSAPV